MDDRQLAAVGSVLGSESRAAIVCALMSGTAHTGSELARHLRVAPSTVSEHLGVLIDAGLVGVEAQGRHRYFRLSGPDVAAAVEQIVAVLPPMVGAPTPRLPAGMAFARSCYDHLAGELGVALHDRFVASGRLHSAPDRVELTEEGRGWFDSLGIPHRAPSTRPVVRRCLDWSQRRHHLGGYAASSLLDHMLTHGWLRRHATRPRELALTSSGRSALRSQLELEV